MHERGTSSKAWNASGTFGSYGINRWTEVYGGKFSDSRLMLTIDSIQSPSETPVIVESAWVECGWINSSNTLPTNFDNPMSAGGSGDLKYVCLDRHNEKINFAAADGSARNVRLNITSLLDLQWHKNW